MHKRNLLFLLLTLPACFPVQPEFDPARQLFYVGGIQINEPDHKEWVEALNYAGLNTIQVTVYATQGEWDSDVLWWKTKEEEMAVVDEIRTAKEGGLHVVLILRVAMDHAFEHNKFMWHGMIFPKNETTAISWFEKYDAFVKMWAKIAEEEGVDVLAIGSELNALSATQIVTDLPELQEYFLNEEKQDEHYEAVMSFDGTINEIDLWVRGFENYTSLEEFTRAQIEHNRKWASITSFQQMEHPITAINSYRLMLNEQWEMVIETAQDHFSGEITYAANFDNYQEVGFWSGLDYIGINAYFPLRKLSSSSLTDKALHIELKSGWEQVFEEIHTFQLDRELSHVPVFFTELGYTYYENSGVRPWAGHGFEVFMQDNIPQILIYSELQEDLTERILAIRTLREVQQDYPGLLRGILYWKLTTKDYHLPYEPFGAWIGPVSNDSLQFELSRFTSN